MKILWAPWRLEYILSDKGKECIFCALPSEDNDRGNLILFRGKKVFVIMNKYPYNGGHIMVVPFFHTSSLEGLDEETMSELMTTVRYSIDCLKKVMRPEGFNVGINIGQAAGAGIEEHIHIHIVPRWAGDASFMTPIAEVRVVPEHILVTYDKLFPVFNCNPS
jgi:ATP adenylyltransferase